MLAIAALVLAAAVPPPANAAPAPVWQTAWSLSQFRTTDVVATARSYRLIVNSHATGHAVRVRFSNRYGDTPVTFIDVHIARRAGGADIEPGSGRPLTFSGQPSVTVPAGAEAVSDPTEFATAPFEDLAVSFTVPSPVPLVTGHFSAFQTSYQTPDGITTDGAATSGAAYSAMLVQTAPLLAGVDALGYGGGSVVALGDSITDGGKSTPDANRRWTDYLQRRLLADPARSRLSVVSAGWSGNQVTRDHAAYGDSALRRLDPDVLDQTGVRAVIVFEGTNDIAGNTPPPATAAELIAGYRQIIARVHARGLPVIGTTLTPAGRNVGAHGLLPQAAATRDEVNRWIRTSGAFDAVIDADRALRDPSDPHAIAPQYDGGDGLHPNDAGMEAIAAAVPLDALPWTGVSKPHGCISRRRGHTRHLARHACPEAGRQ